MSCEKRYAQLESDRNIYLQRARSAARLTLPYLIPQNDSYIRNQAETYPLPWNGIGARGVHNIASRLVLALLPPTETFFRFTFDELKQAADEQDLIRGGADPNEIAKAKSEFEATLSLMERAVLRSIETSNDRVAVLEMLQHLIVGGNVLGYVGSKGLRAFHLNRYVLRRDPMGSPLEAIVCEELSADSLPQKVEDALAMADGEPRERGEETETMQHEEEEDTSEYDRVVRLYTHIEWEDEQVSWYQEIKGVEIPGSRGTAKLAESPWLPLRMYRIDGSDYSPGYVEAACQADLQTAEALSQAIAEGSLVSAQVKHLVRPAGVTNAKQLAEAANGAFVPGNPDDVTTISVNKGGDLRVAMEGLARVEARLSQAFMLMDVRDSERTTAEEVRLQSLQIEQSLGAIYSILTVEFQQPYISRKLALLWRDSKLPKLPNNLVKPVVSVGLAAVGRGNDLEKTARFMTLLQQTLGPEGIATYVQPSELIRRLAASMGMDTMGLVKRDEQLAAEQQQQQQMAMAQQAMAAGMADPQKLANAAAVTQQMAAPPPADAQPTEQPPA